MNLDFTETSQSEDKGKVSLHTSNWSGKAEGLTSIDRPIHAPPAVHRIAAGHYCCVLLVLGLADCGGGQE